MSEPVVHHNPRILSAMEKDEDIQSYSDGFRNLIWFVKVESLAMVAMSLFVYYYISHFVPQDSYYAVGVNGNRTHLVGLDAPNTNKTTLLAWVSSSVTQVMTFGFDDVDARMANAEHLFSPDGWKSFQASIKAGDFLKNVVDYQQILTAIPISPPTIQAEGILEGQYRWVVHVTIAVTTRAGSARNTAKMNVNLIIVKMPTSENPMGLGINTWIGG